MILERRQHEDLKQVIERVGGSLPFLIHDYGSHPSDHTTLRPGVAVMDRYDISEWGVEQKGFLVQDDSGWRRVHDLYAVADALHCTRYTSQFHPADACLS